MAQVIDKGGHTGMDHKHAAGSIPAESWDCDFASKVWQVKWVTQGLTPVRPSVVLTTDVGLKPQQALPLKMKP